MSVGELQQRVRRLGGYLRRLDALKGGAAFVIASVSVAAASFLIDWFLVLPLVVRGLLLFGSITLLVTIVYRGLVRPLVGRRSEEQLALLVERRFPEMKDGLISSLQFAKKASGEAYGESTSLQEMVIADTAKRASTFDFHAVVDSGVVHRFAALALFVVAIPVVLLAALPGFRQYAAIWWKRDVALSSAAMWPRQTFLEVYFREGKNIFVTQQKDVTVVSVAQGDDLTVCVKANGKVPPKVSLYYQPVTGDAKAAAVQEVRAMAQVGERDFQYAFVGVSDSLAFYVEGGDDRDGKPSFLVRVVPTPRVESLTLSCTYPAYMRREPTTTTEGNLRVPIGTRVDLLVRTNMKVECASLVIEKDATRALDPVDEQTFRGGFVVGNDLTYSVTLVGEHGLTDRNPLRFQVKGLPDEAPKVLAMSPSVYEFDATPEGLALLKTLSTDDYGIADLRLLVKLPRDEKPVEIPIIGDSIADDGQPFQAGGIRAISVRTLAVADLPAESDGKKLDVGDSFYFRVEARDERTSAKGEPDPNVGRCQDFRVTLTSRIDLERKLSDWQLRIKDDVKKLRKVQDKTKSDLDFFLTPEETVRALDPAERQKLLDLEIAQNRVTTDSKRLTTDFVHLFDAYVFNRFEKGPYADRILSTLVDAARDPKADAWAGYRKLVTEANGGGGEESEVLGKILGMVARGFTISETLSPDAARALTTARLLPEGDDRLPALRSTAEKQQAILDELDRLLKKMDEWEDYQGILDAMKQLIEDQKAIRSRTLSEIKK
ncbi:MAG: hypothetical protein HYR85_23775 [Planctomycetes bacterium]|nr:hypothetical protein [Planctomycetota bacterium]MBI3845925.1 hypothetical protein [Planctomycetota bacterium]